MDQNQKTRLVTRLKAEIEDLPPRLKRIAKYIIDHPGDFGMDPIRVTAGKVGVSPNSLVRLAQRMGFDGFDGLRAPFRAALITDGEEPLGAAWQGAGQDIDGVARAQADLARNEVNIISRSLRLMSQEKIETALGFLIGARGAYVTATRASYALAYYFHYVGRMALPGLQLIPRHMGSAVDELIHVDDRDTLLAITFAPYSADTIQSMRFAKERGAKLILVGDSDVIAPQVAPDVTFPVSTQSHHSFGGYAGGMAVLDCLIGHLVNAGGAAAHQRIADYEAIREDTGAYWRAPRLPKVRG